MNTNVFGILALVLVGVLFGSAVGAVDISAITHSGITANGESKADLASDGVTVTRVPGIQSYHTEVKVEKKEKAEDKVFVASRASVLANVNAQLKVMSKEKKDEAKSIIKELKQVIKEFREKRKNDESQFQGWSVERLINASGLSVEQKNMLLSKWKESKTKDSAEPWQRHKFVMVNLEQDFVAIGKFTAEKGSMDNFWYGRGFSTVYDKRFLMIGANGVLVGLQNHHTFWGTYDSDSVRLTYDTGAVYEAQFKVYD